MFVEPDLSLALPFENGREKIMKYHIITFGCQMNKNDSERIESVLLSAGMKKAEGPEDADLIVLNSCSVRDASEQRVIGMVHNFNELKNKIRT